jgi:uracil-DNA glycosylase
VFRAARSARLLIVGQAPGRRVHESGIPWNDPSGDVLRGWLAMEREAFYDASRIAIVPVGLCYPGTVDGADLPPRRECAPRWHPLLLPRLRSIELTLAIGGYAMDALLGKRKRATLTDTVRVWREYLDTNTMPLPHPSPRNTAWFIHNPWFELEAIPALRERVRELLL